MTLTQALDLGLQVSLGGDVAQMVERSLSMREVRGSMPRISNKVHFSGRGQRQVHLVQSGKHRHFTWWG